MSKLVSVVVPCFQEENAIKTCLDSLRNSALQNLEIEILVVDGMSRDQSRDIVKGIAHIDERVKLIDNPARKTPFALNKGIREAKGEYVMIASAHSSFDKHYIQSLFNEMQRLNADVVGGEMETEVRKKSAVSLAIKAVLSHSLGVGNSKFRTGVKEASMVDTVPFGLYKRQLLLDAGLYDTRLIRNHDMELSKRLISSGAKIYLIPGISCTYYARETLGALSKNAFDNGFWNVKTIFITKNYKSLSLRHFVPMMFVLSLLLPSIIAAFYSAILIFPCLVLLVYFLSILIVASRVEAKLFSTIQAFFVLHFSYGIGSIFSLFLPSKS